MNAIIERLWRLDEPKLFITRQQYEDALDGWAITVHIIDGEPAHVALSKGPAFHFRNLGTNKPLPMRVIRVFLQSLIDQYGYAETRTPFEDERQQRFNRLIGFVEAGVDKYDVIYRIERIRGCQSRPSQQRP